MIGWFRITIRFILNRTIGWRATAFLSTLICRAFSGTFSAATTFLFILWLSVFLYTSLYYAFVPVALIVSPIHFHFDSDCRTPESPHRLCSFPSAYIPLTQGIQQQRLLMRGQPYSVNVELEAPLSSVNRKLGMFMVHLEFYSGSDLVPERDRPVQQSSRPSLFQFRSDTVTSSWTLLWLPWFLAGSADERQTLSVTMFEDFQDLAYNPAKEAFVELRTRDIEVYSSRLLIQAKLSGLRYFMHSYPVVSAAFGIWLNFCGFCLVLSVTWYQFAGSSEPPEFITSGDPQTSGSLTPSETPSGSDRGVGRRGLTDSRRGLGGTSTSPRGLAAIVMRRYEGLPRRESLEGSVADSTATLEDVTDSPSSGGSESDYQTVSEMPYPQSSTSDPQSSAYLTHRHPATN